MMRVIHVAPELPPTVGGVADYTAILSRRLVEVSDGAVDPVLVHAGKDPTDTIEVEFPIVDQSGEQSAGALANTVRRLANEANEAAAVLLEYSGYGYAKRGAPLWLARGLRRVCEEEEILLVTMFHELYATGPPWTSAFWVSPLQRFVASRIAKMSGGIVANRSSAVRWLQRYRSSKALTIQVQPVFSNVGEPDTLPAFEDRFRHGVVFGGGGRKSAIYNKHRNLLRSLVERNGITKILDIGPTRGHFPAEESWSQSLGVLTANDISHQLESVSLGVLSYPGSRLGKSGVAAAFASHGVPFLLLDEEETRGDTDPYVEGEHFLRSNAVEDSEAFYSKDRLLKMSRSIQALYQDRLHSTHAARCFLELLQPATHASTSTQERRTR
jgi:hypothetical protein